MALRGRIGAYRLHACHDPRETTAAARQAFLARFETEVDPAGVLPPAERQRRALSARRAYFARLALKSGASAPSTRTAARVRSLRAEVRTTQQRLAGPLHGVRTRPPCPQVRIAHVGVHMQPTRALPPHLSNAERLLRRLQRTVRRGANQRQRDRCGALPQRAPASAKGRGRVARAVATYVATYVGWRQTRNDTSVGFKRATASDLVLHFMATKQGAWKCSPRGTLIAGAPPEDPVMNPRYLAVLRALHRRGLATTGQLSALVFADRTLRTCQRCLKALVERELVAAISLRHGGDLGGREDNAYALTARGATLITAEVGVPPGTRPRAPGPNAADLPSRDGRAGGKCLRDPAFPCPAGARLRPGTLGAADRSPATLSLERRLVGSTFRLTGPDPRSIPPPLAGLRRGCGCR